MAMLEWMDMELLAFIERYARQWAQWHVTAYFGSHSQSTSSVRDIAQDTGISEASVAASVHELADLGLLDSCLAQEPPQYQLTPDPRLRALAQRFAHQSATLLRMMDTPLIVPGASI